jgi:hypothetical protein
MKKKKKDAKIHQRCSCINRTHFAGAGAISTTLKPQQQSFTKQENKALPEIAASCYSAHEAVHGIKLVAQNETSFEGSP